MAAAPAAAPAVAEAADDGRLLIDKNLAASVQIYNMLNTELQKDRNSPSITLSRKDALKLRRAAVVCNQSLGAIVKSGRAREDRLIVEQHLMRQTAQRDRTDFQAHRARILDRMREQHACEKSVPPVERALKVVGQVERALAALSPTGAQNAHGAPMLAARELCAPGAPGF